jgi:hypothetical protein
VRNLWDAAFIEGKHIDGPNGPGANRSITNNNNNIYIYIYEEKVCLWSPC